MQLDHGRGDEGVGRGAEGQRVGEETGVDPAGSLWEAGTCRGHSLGIKESMCAWMCVCAQCV